MKVRIIENGIGKNFPQKWVRVSDKTDNKDEKFHWENFIRDGAVLSFDALEDALKFVESLKIKVVWEGDV